jgi:hypothetical protein
MRRHRYHTLLDDGRVRVAALGVLALLCVLVVAAAVLR